MTGAIDIQASNMGAVGRELYLAGARVVGLYPMGPRPAVAAMVTMLSYDGTCCVTVNADPEAISDPTPSPLASARASMRCSPWRIPSNGRHRDDPTLQPRR